MLVAVAVMLCGCNEPETPQPDNAGNGQIEKPEDEKPELPDDGKVVYEVGDTYSKKGVTGIVFHVTDEGKHGKIASADKSVTTMVWSTESVETGAVDETDGKKNMAAIQSIDGWREKYPPFAWCADMGEGWYLPAKDELEALDKSGVFIAYATEYWSSTESGKDRAWYVSNYVGTVGSYTKSGAKNRVRAIYAF